MTRLYELFDNTPLNWKTDTQALFKVNDEKFFVSFLQLSTKTKWMLAFATYSGADTSIDVTGNLKNSASKVFGAVITAITQFVTDKHPETDEIVFSGDPSHAAFYEKLARMVGGAKAKQLGYELFSRRSDGGMVYFALRKIKNPIDSMREHINLLSKPILVENVANMFDKFLKAAAQHDMTGEIKPFIDIQVKWAKTILKKNDRIVWFLRWIQLFAARHLCIQNPNDFTEFYQKYLSDFNKANATTLSEEDVRKIEGRLAIYKTTLEHFYSLPINSIQTYVMDRQPIEQVIDTFKKFERIWQEENKRLMPYQDEKVVVGFPDGMMWVHLPRGYCDEESKAMGHCGNAGASHGETILSLRRMVAHGEHKFWEPFLTFILDKDGYLGEMKGRNNDKPVPRYFPYIVKLLENDIIKGIKGGGYLPSHNFNINDLDEAEQDRLYAIKPDLAPLSYQYRKFGMTPKLANKIIEDVADKADLSRNEMSWSPDSWREVKFLNLKKFDNWQAVIKKYGSSEAIGALDMMEDYIDIDISGEDCENMFNSLPNKTINKIGAHFVEKHPKQIEEWEEENDEDFDPTSAKDIFRLIEHLDDDEMSLAIRCAASSGYESGTYEQIYKAFERLFGESVETDNDDYILFLAFDNPKDEFMWDTEVYLQIGITELLDNLDNLTEDCFDIARGSLKIDTPHYGWTEYDSDAAKERFFEEYPEFR